jgi:hypothetical protein
MDSNELGGGGGGGGCEDSEGCLLIPIENGGFKDPDRENEGKMSCACVCADVCV